MFLGLLSVGNRPRNFGKQVIFGSLFFAGGAVESDNNLRLLRAHRLSMTFFSHMRGAPARCDTYVHAGYLGSAGRAHGRHNRFSSFTAM